MQDRFKLRAWNKLSNELKDVISLNINYEFPDCSNVILETNTFDNIKTHNNSITCANGLNNVVLMQCTGLKDKNGKLIYEGDIIKFKDNITINGSKIHKSVVEHNEVFNAFMYHAECMGLYTVNKAQNERFDIEVIGNIYENKELLNE